MVDMAFFHLIETPIQSAQGWPIFSKSAGRLFRRIQTRMFDLNEFVG